MKKTLTVMMMVLMAMMLFVSCENKAKEPEKKTYKVGDEGPAGGWIFYVNPNAEKDGWTYLEVAPSNAPGSGTIWESSSTDVNHGTEKEIGTGKANTDELLKIAGGDFPAAKACDNYSQGGYSDWFLPSVKELEYLANTMSKINGLSLGGERYWTSSEYSEGSVYALDISSEGGLSAAAENSMSVKSSTSCVVRPVRSF